ncbi:antitoxin protein of toxin-antitoxin system [Knoellia remsis]|uniref:Antitoxin protein of toxin-antitoxin system n=1 Tax=Knoellia remsis TaxID=407159 RepID=A0A2T0UGS4_9MICO|nr:antitoxin [Knoellia remsis]PRY57139.1 antitoxin protein of toxin-antitoxin system [Knoellia remsis]
MARLGKLGALAGAAAAAKKYIQENPEKADQYLGKAADFANKRTKGKYSRQIDSASGKARDAVIGKNRGVGGAAPQPGQPGTNPNDPQAPGGAPRAGSW